jgi:RNA polymerase sigma-70 factor (ECF subfamily)
VERSSTRDIARDPAALVEELAAEVGPLAFGVAMSMLGDRGGAEDAMHDAFVQAFTGLRSFRGDASLKTWFLKIVVNCCKRHRRLWRRWVVGAAAATSTIDSALREQVHVDSLGDPGLRARLEQAVLGLPHRQRTAFVLRYQQDLTIDEIAAVMECAPGTVKATLHKAVHKLREELADVGRG